MKVTAAIIDYTNWKGERATRRIVPDRIRWGVHAEFHPEPGWLLEAWDLDKQAFRTFKLNDIHAWRDSEEKL